MTSKPHITPAVGWVDRPWWFCRDEEIVGHASSPSEAYRLWELGKARARVQRSGGPSLLEITSWPRGVPEVSGRVVLGFAATLSRGIVH